MKNVLIICHDFPPLNTVAAKRPKYWMEQLSEFGYRPVIFTKHWPENLSNHQEKFKAADLPDQHESNDAYELHQIACDMSHRDRHISTYGIHGNPIGRKVKSFVDWYHEYHSMANDAFKPLFNAIDDYLSKYEVFAIIVTGGPFHFFKYGWFFHKKNNIPWVADYRDQWKNLSGIGNNKKNLFQRTEPALEKKWTSNAEFFTTVSDGMKERLEAQLGIKGFVVRNGYDPKLIPDSENAASDVFKIGFAGTIYDDPYLKIVVPGIEHFIEAHKEENDFLFQFIGIEIHHTRGTEVITDLSVRQAKHVEVLPPTPYRECLQLLAQCSVLLSLKCARIADGFIGTKLYDYIALNKVIINIEPPGKKSHSFSKFLTECKSVSEFSAMLDKLYSDWKSGNLIKPNHNESEAIQFSKIKQTERLAIALNSIEAKS